MYRNQTTRELLPSFVFVGYCQTLHLRAWSIRRHLQVEKAVVISVSLQDIKDLHVTAELFNKYIITLSGLLI